MPKSANGEEANARRGFLAGSGSDGDPLLASSLARFWPGDEAANAEDEEGARRLEEVELMAAGTGGERRWRRVRRVGSTRERNCELFA